VPTILAISCAEEHGFSKQPKPHLRLIAGEGIEGDAHRGITTQHLYLKRKDPTLPNLCQVHLIASELLEELVSKGYALEPGELGENILTSGIELLTLPRGTLLHLGIEAIVEVTGLRTPCSQIDGHRSGLQQHLWGERDATGKRTRRAGIMCIVLTGGIIHPNDSIRVVLPPEPHLPLGPV
jgi:MOSC domain-containing protein YiiM